MLDRCFQSNSASSGYAIVFREQVFLSQQTERLRRSSSGGRWRRLTPTNTRSLHSRLPPPPLSVCALEPVSLSGDGSESACTTTRKGERPPPPSLPPIPIHQTMFFHRPSDRSRLTSAAVFFVQVLVVSQPVCALHHGASSPLSSAHQRNVSRSKRDGGIVSGPIAGALVSGIIGMTAKVRKR